eukprot:gnl/TRDRNA2_/TRDRNA2_196571_c0_seq1.p1 gnl/TRDRNA2_/TRDRNA2_196571_c0~~gnl/TRDRNA2_/TRDRNA2_196571_c0_seq1.p1  ORF type:complete len:133 (+),score=22.69 gnl/TRDRNA2_/TRDRNA2_196571_c0_seq1:205-603(+)
MGRKRKGGDDAAPSSSTAADEAAPAEPKKVKNNRPDLLSVEDLLSTEIEHRKERYAINGKLMVLRQQRKAEYEMGMRVIPVDSAEARQLNSRLRREEQLHNEVLAELTRRGVQPSKEGPSLAGCWKRNQIRG